MRKTLEPRKNVLLLTLRKPERALEIWRLPRKRWGGWHWSGLACHLEAGLALLEPHN